MRDWLDWHHTYDDPASPLARRLEVVKRQLNQALDELTATKPRLLSLCAGDGRDVISVLAARTAPPHVAAVLIENDTTLARRAREVALGAGVSSIQVRCLDAGDLASFSDVLPVDVLLLCGIFGNIDHSAVKSVIDAIPRLVSVGGYVIWTRGESEPDRRPEIREWFKAAGLEEVVFEGPPEPYGVGVNRQRYAQALSQARPTSGRLFTFYR